jgi:lysozyme family protein
LVSEFERSLTKVLVHEGGFVNHPKDPGGATNRGVTQRVYDDYLKSRHQSSKSVKDITSGEVEAIYRQKYWNLIKGDSLPAGVSYVVFDGAVNSGVSQSAKWLQRALGVNADGVIGPATIEAVNSLHDHDALIDRILDRRLAFLKALKTWSTFGKGWAARVDGVRRTGKAWARNTAEPAVGFIAEGNAKGFLSDAKSPPSRAPGDAAAGAGGLSVVISQTQEQLMPYTNIDFVAKVMATLAIAGAGIAIGGLAYRFWAKRKADEIKDALDLAVPA